MIKKKKNQYINILKIKKIKIKCQKISYILKKFLFKDFFLFLKLIPCFYIRRNQVRKGKYKA